MKTLLLSILVLAASICTYAATPHVHIYRTDSVFHYMRASDIASISYTLDASGNVAAMCVAGTDGTAEAIPAGVVERVRTDSVALPELSITLDDYPDLPDLVKEWGKTFIYKAKLTVDGNGLADDIDAEPIEIRGRGNSTWRMDKKPYRIKFAKKRSFCGLPKAKSFALIANYIDCSHVRNALAFETARLLGMPFANHAVPVRVRINGGLRGLYLLTEKIGIGSGSVDIDENTGALFELDTNFDEDNKFHHIWTEDTLEYKLPVMLKDPDVAEVAEALGETPDEYWGRWSADITRMLDAVLAGGDLNDVLDMKSVVDYLIVNLLAGNNELGYPKSMFVYKASSDDVYHFGPVWDFDWSFTYDGGENIPADHPLFFDNERKAGSHFLRRIILNPAFVTAFEERWQYFVAELYPQLINYLDTYSRLIEPAAKEDGLMWPTYVTDDWDMKHSSYGHELNIARLRAWLDARIDYINTAPYHGLLPAVLQP